MIELILCYNESTTRSSLFSDVLLFFSEDLRSAREEQVPACTESHESTAVAPQVVLGELSFRLFP